MIVAVVPMKPLIAAKRRLGGVLSDERRRTLAATMLTHVLDRLAACPTIDRRFVLTADPEVAVLASRHAAEHLPEDAPAGLNEAVRAGAALAARLGAEAMVYLPGDVPLATAREIETFVLRLQPGAAVIVPSHDRDGTNGLALSPPTALAPAFGTGSFKRHVEAACAAGLDLVVLELPGLARDIDTGDDLDVLLREKAGGPRYRFLWEAAAANPRLAGVR